MILRMWGARSTAGGAADYIRHATTKVFPKIRAIEGYKGEYLLRRDVKDSVELVVLTLGTRSRRFDNSRDRSRTRR